MSRRSLLGGTFLFLSIGGAVVIMPQVLWGSATVLNVCIIAHPGDICDPLNTPTSPPATGGGGGGGGNGSPLSAFNPNAGEVYFSGTAYPLSVVTLVRDGQILATASAGPDARFQFNITNVTPGTYTYGIWSEDNRGIRSVTNSFSVSVAQGVGTVISGIYLPPTIDIDKSSVKFGDPITFLGVSAPNAHINIIVHSSQELLKTTSTDNKGQWKYVLDSTELELGSHDAAANSKSSTGISALSKQLQFTVGDTNVIKPSRTCGGVVSDINCDAKVNLVDFSILAYWYHRPFSPTATKADLNHDGKINLKDFSILAYYWTG